MGNLRGFPAFLVFFSKIEDREERINDREARGIQTVGKE